jgi:hypothetical protein
MPALWQLQEKGRAPEKRGVGRHHNFFRFLNITELKLDALPRENSRISPPDCMEFSAQQQKVLLPIP